MFVHEQKNAKLMRWHKEEHKLDNILRHPTDGSQWRKVDRTFPTFANNARNIRFGLSTDGMNPFGEQSRRHDHYGGKAAHRTKPRHRCGKMVFEMVKDIKVVFGKGSGS